MESAARADQAMGSLYSPVCWMRDYKMDRQGRDEDREYLDDRDAPTTWDLASGVSGRRRGGTSTSATLRHYCRMKFQAAPKPRTASCFPGLPDTYGTSDAPEVKRGANDSHYSVFLLQDRTIPCTQERPPSAGAQKLGTPLGRMSPTVPLPSPILGGLCWLTAEEGTNRLAC